MPPQSPLQRNIIHYVGDGLDVATLSKVFNLSKDTIKTALSGDHDDYLMEIKYPLDVTRQRTSTERDAVFEAALEANIPVASGRDYRCCTITEEEFYRRYCAMCKERGVQEYCQDFV